MSTTQSNQVTPSVRGGGPRRLPVRLPARANVRIDTVQIDEVQIDLDAVAAPLSAPADPRTGADQHLLRELTTVLDWLGQPASRQPVR